MSYTETNYHERVWAKVDLDAILENTENLHQRMQPQSKMNAVIKADAYGHGAVKIAKKLENLDYLWGFSTATVEEALELKKAGIQKPILILGYTFPYCYEDLAKEELRQTVFREDTLEELSQVALKMGKTIFVHIAVDTGLSRIGITPDDKGLAYVKKALSLPGIAVEGIFTHFAKADTLDNATTKRQADLFSSFCDRIRTELHTEIPICHCSNSAALIRFPEFHMDMVRAGIVLYGLWPSSDVPRDIVELTPALSLYSRVVCVKTVPAGTGVSYGLTYVAQKETRIATIPVGYGDGYPRGLSNKGSVLIRGMRAPILGRVCMDQFMVDVTKIPGVCEGDLVTLIGHDGTETISMEELADLSRRFNYEFACNLGQRIPRVYKG